MYTVTLQSGDWDSRERLLFLPSQAITPDELDDESERVIRLIWKLVARSPQWIAATISCDRRPTRVEVYSGKLEPSTVGLLSKAEFEKAWADIPSHQWRG